MLSTPRILGQLLFLLNVNDLSWASDALFHLLFADDSNLFRSGKCPERLIEQMNNEMIKIIDCLNINKLSLNLKKTHFIIFRKRRGNIHIDNDLVVDLSYESHVNHIKGKISRGIGISYKAKKYLNETMYYASSRAYKIRAKNGTKPWHMTSIYALWIWILVYKLWIWWS